MESLKRTASERDNQLEGIKAVLLDIEGTTTPISFVQDTLFKYVRENVQAYLDSHWDDEECKEDVDKLRQQAEDDKKAEVEGLVEILDKEKSKEEVLPSVVNNVLWQMDEDRETASLKQLQGHIWREAYKTGKLKGELFADVEPAVRSWSSGGRKVFVYSSGSVEAQKLLFGHSSGGDLREMLAGYFDTEIGSKVEKDSYGKIAKQVECNPDEVLFLTDVAKEARAAAEAGMSVCIVSRDGNDPLSEEDQKQFNTIKAFSELEAEAAATGDKAAKVDSADTTNGEATEDAQQGQGDAPAAEEVPAQQEVA